MGKITPPATLTVVPEEELGHFQKLDAEDVLAPGYYWRLKNDLNIPDPRWEGHHCKLYAGDVHLLVDIFEFEGAPHTAVLLSHPRNLGDIQHHRILIADFLANLDPAKDAELVRSAELDEIMHGVVAMQDEMAQAQGDPLALPGVKEAVDEAVEKFQREMVAEVAVSQKDQTERASDLRKIHRRAARRSSAAGNPMVARSVTISDQVGLMITGGINSEGLQELTAEARKRIAIAEATSKWLQKRTEDLATKLKCLTPYYAEKAQVALARSKKAVKYVRDITQGLNSLKLYTGDGVDVVPILEGASASTAEPLTLVQGKRYMDEELAVWANVDDSFDWRSKNQFFDALKTNPSLVDQVFPASRCVVSMAVTRRDISYGQQVSVIERLMNKIRNQEVFLLVRDGQNVHVVYSCEPSHEAAIRLFPTQKEIEGPFKGIDGSAIGLQDVAFGKSAERFDDVSLHYKRFLILLCGLDHRMRLFGEFYPPEGAVQFMTLAFQQRYFRFLEDDNPDRLIGEDLEPVKDWIERCNTAVRSGSRVVTSQKSDLTASSPQLKRSRSMVLDDANIPAQLVVARDKGRHCISVPTRGGRYNLERGQATVWLDGLDSKNGRDWFLCMDLVRLETVRRYIYSRVNRTGHISWLRTFKRAEAILMAEMAQQADLRAALAKAALDNGVLATSEVTEAIEAALATWRAAHRGADAPALTDTKAIHELLTLMYPNDRIAQSTDQWITRLIQSLGSAPLMLCRTGKTRLALYVEATPQDKEPYADAVHWGWVKRVLVDVLKTKLSVASTSLVWMEKDKPDATETLVRDWPGLTTWVQEHPEPCPLRWLADAKQEIATQAEQLGDVLAQGRSQPVRSGISEAFMLKIIEDAASAVATLTYNEPIFTAILIGVYQQAARSPVHFLYASVNTANFVQRYGSPGQWAEYKAKVLHGKEHYVRRALADSFRWNMLQTREPIKKAAFRSNQVKKQFPEWQFVKSHHSGGVKRRDRGDFFDREKSTRAKRRAEGGDPKHRTATLGLSWNRSIETLIGVAPHLRRQFYAGAERRASTLGSIFDVNYAAIKKAELNRKYEPHPPRHQLSPLVWDPARGRSVANRYFSVAK